MIHQKFPFLKSFPFDHYDISMGKEREINEDGQVELFDNEELYDFKYVSRDKDITISFYDTDIDFLNELSSEITKLDSVRKNIDKGLESDEISVKMAAIKKTKTFLKKVKSPAEDTTTFKTVLDGLQEINEVELSDKAIKKIDKLDKKLEDEKLNTNEVITIHSFLDFQLHHAKIMLGIIIASKIH